MRSVWITLLLAAASAFTAFANDCIPVYKSDACVFEEDNVTVSITTDRAECAKYPDNCCWRSGLCRSRSAGTGETVKSDANPFPVPKANKVKNKIKASQRSLGIFPGLGCPPPIAPFPSSCKYKRHEPFVTEPPMNIPYCVRIPCTLDMAKQKVLDKKHFDCGSQPGCYFDLELFEYRQAFGPAVLAGVPVCHYAIRNSVFHMEALKVVKTLGNWNPYFTNCLLTTFADKINEEPVGCKLIPILKTFKILPKMAGWKNINSYHCRLIDGCWRMGEGCFHQVQMDQIVVKSGQRFIFNRHEIVYGRPKCQNFNQQTPYEIMKSYHNCLTAGCSVDANVAALYHHYLFQIGSQMKVGDHWEYWKQVELGKIGPHNIESIFWEFDKSFKSQPQPMPTSKTVGHPFAPPPSAEGGSPFMVPGGGGPPSLFGPPQGASQPNPFDIPAVPTLPPVGTSKSCGAIYRQYGARPCSPPVVPKFHQNTYCPYKPFFVPRFKPLKGSFIGCCEINACYLSRRDIRRMHSGPSYYYTEWSFFTACSASCGRGTQKRFRKCVSHDNSMCTEDIEQTRSCKIIDCGKWTRWNDWTPCPGYCGVQSRTRTCLPDKAYCRGDEEEVKRCNCPS